jgi:hypothetical protein
LQACLQWSQLDERRPTVVQGQGLISARWRIHVGNGALFRIYKIGSHGHYIGVQEIECANDQEAIQNAQQIVDGHDVELWERGRFIARLVAKPGTQKLAASVGAIPDGRISPAKV